MISWLVFTLWLAQGAPAAEKTTARVEGKVVNAITGEPLGKAMVTLHGGAAIGLAAFVEGKVGLQPAYSFTTAADGKFVLEEIKAGTYVLMASRNGFVPAAYGARVPGMNATPVQLNGARSISGVIMKLTPQALLFGRVLDEDDEPVPGAMVKVMRSLWNNGKRELRVMAAERSQADGSFVLGGLNPGRYYVSADYSGPLDYRNPVAPASRESYVETYFPSTTSSAAAGAIDLAAGRAMHGIDIHMRKGRRFDISGRVSGGKAPGTPEMQMIPKPPADYKVYRPQIGTLESEYGTFRFRGVPAGTYIVETRDEFEFGRIEVTIDDSDLKDVVLPVGAGIEIAGRITSAGDPPGSWPTVQFQRVAGAFQFGDKIEIHPDGTFREPGLLAEPLRVAVENLPPGFYVKSIRFGGREVADRMLDLSSGGGELEILLSPNAPDIKGIVRDEDGRAVPGARVQLCNSDQGVVNAATTDPSGAFQFANLAPGEYKLYAWEYTGNGVITVPEFRVLFDARAAKIKLEENDHANGDLKVIPIASMDEEAAKIP